MKKMNRKNKEKLKSWNKLYQKNTEFFSVY